MSEKPSADLTAALPPQNRGAEVALLATILTSNAAYHDVSDLIRAEDFYVYGHQVIWKAIVSLIGSRQPADVVTVLNWLKAAGLDQDAGGPAYLAQLHSKSTSITACETHARIIQNKAILRDLVEAGRKLSERAFEQLTSSDELIAQIHGDLFDVQRRAFSGEQYTNEQVMAETLEMLDRRAGIAAGCEIDEPVMTGLVDLDKLTSGMQKREYIILAARPSVGKSLVALNVVVNAAKDGHRVFFSSLEQGRQEMGVRMLSREARVAGHKFRKGNFEPEERQRIGEAERRLAGLPIIWDDNASQTATRVAAVAQRLHNKHPLDLIVVDYLQYLQEESRGGTRNEEVAAMSRRMKNIARDLGIPVLCLAQLNRDNDKQNRSPRISDLRDSGGIEQDADAIWLLHKTEPPDMNRPRDMMELTVGKQRNGPCGEITLIHEKRFFNVANFQPESPPAPRDF